MCVVYYLATLEIEMMNRFQEYKLVRFAKRLPHGIELCVEDGRRVNEIFGRGTLVNLAGPRAHLEPTDSNLALDAAKWNFDGLALCHTGNPIALVV